VPALCKADQLRLVKDRRAGRSWNGLTRKYRIARGTLAKVLRRHGITLRPMRRLSSGEEERVIRGYQRGHSMSWLAAHQTTSMATVLRTLRRRGVAARSLVIACRRRKLDETAFDEVTEASAYWTGFLMADGSIEAKTLGHGSPVIVLTVGVKDAGHLVRFKRFLSAGHKITISRRERKIAIASRRLAAQLARYGVVPRKTKRTRVLHLGMNRHFWRGVVDGDGSVIVGKPTMLFPAGSPILILYGSRPLLTQFQRFVRHYWPDYGGHVSVRPGCCRISLKGHAARRILRALYQNGAVALPRKRSRAQTLIHQLA
jgi:hypothetical protein